MLLLTDKNQAHVVEASSSSSRYLADLLNINNYYLSQICPADLQLNKAISSECETPFLDLVLSIANDIISSKVFKIKETIFI